jgi:hypothetical protein
MRNCARPVIHRIQEFRPVLTARAPRTGAGRRAQGGGWTRRCNSVAARMATYHTVWRTVCLILVLDKAAASHVGSVGVGSSESSGSIHRPTVPASVWRRTRCGSPASPGTDIVTTFGATVTADNVKTIFGYPRPQMTRSSYHSLNGLWEFQPMQWLPSLAAPSAAPANCHGSRNCDGARPPFGTQLNQTVLVPFPVESCLSGLENASLPGTPPTYQRMVYRTLIDGSAALEEAAAVDNRGGDGTIDDGEVLLHFGAVDWQADVYINGLWVGSHEGGYDSFSFPIADALRSRKVGDEWQSTDESTLDEILVIVHDPSNYGSQPFGKQRTSAMWRPAGDTYSPNSGIWQSVWLESVPTARIEALKIAPNSTHLRLNVQTTIPPTAGAVTVTVTKHGQTVVSTKGQPNLPFAVEIPQPELWSPEKPFL